MGQSLFLQSILLGNTCIVHAHAYFTCIFIYAYPTILHPIFSHICTYICLYPGKVLRAWKCSFNFLGYISFNISHVLSLEVFLQFSGIYLFQYMSCAGLGSIPPIFWCISSSIYVIFLAFSICISFILEFLLVFLNPNDIPDLQICWDDHVFK